MYCQAEDSWGAPLDLGSEARWVAPLYLGQETSGGAPVEVVVGAGVGVCVVQGTPLEVVVTRDE